METSDYLEILNNIRPPVTKEDPRSELRHMRQTFDNQDKALLDELKTQANAFTHLINNIDPINKALGTDYTEQEILENNIYHKFKKKLAFPHIVDTDDIKAMPVLEKIKSIHQAQQDLADNFYNRRYQLAEYLHRGTATDELDTMLLGQKAWAENITNKKYTYLTTNPEIARDYATGRRHRHPDADLNNVDLNGVVIKFKKTDIEDHIVEQGYAIKWRYVKSDDINKPERMDLVEEEEYRLKSDVDINNVMKQITIFDVSESEQEDYLQTYGGLGPIEFVMGDEF